MSKITRRAAIVGAAASVAALAIPSVALALERERRVAEFVKAYEALPPRDQRAVLKEMRLRVYGPANSGRS